MSRVTEAAAVLHRAMHRLPGVPEHREYASPRRHQGRPNPRPAPGRRHHGPARPRRRDDRRG